MYAWRACLRGYADVGSVCNYDRVPMTCFNQYHARTDANAIRRTPAGHAVEAGVARPGPPPYRDNIDSASQQPGNRAFMYWVGALCAAGLETGTREQEAGQAQDPDTLLQFMPKKRKKKEPAAAAEPGVLTEAPPELPPKGEEETTAAGEKKKKKKSRVQVALNALRGEGVEQFGLYIKAEIEEMALLSALMERVQRAEDLRSIRNAALGTIAARMEELDPEGIPVVPQAAMPASVPVAGRPVVAPAMTIMNFRERELLGCCMSGNAGKARILLKYKNINVNASAKSCTLLLLAALEGHTAVVRELLSVPDIDVNLAQTNGITPLYAAVQNGHLEIVRLLMGMRGINPASGTIDGGVTPLTLAAHKGHDKIAELLLSFRSVNINIRQHDGGTPLFAAVQSNSTKIVKLLVSRGADVNIPLTNGTTPLCRAAAQDNVEIVDHLLQVPGIQVNRTGDEKVTALYFACQMGQVEAARLLLGKKADPNIADIDGVAPLHLACVHGFTEIVEILVEAGADMKLLTKDDYSPYLIACIGGHRAIVELLEARFALKREQTVRPEGLSSCVRHAGPAPLRAQEGGQVPDDRPEQSTASRISPVSLTQPSDMPEGVTEAAVQTPRVVRGDAPGGGTQPAGISRSMHTPDTPSGAATADDQPRAAAARAPLEQAKKEFRRDILTRLRTDRLDPLDGIRLMEAVNTVADLDNLCRVYNRLAGIERTKFRAGRRRTWCRFPAAEPPADAEPSGYALGEKQALDAETVEDKIRQHLAGSYHRFISQAVNDMEFGRGKPTPGYPGVLHVSAGITGVGSCSVFFTLEDEAKLIRIVGIGHHLDRRTYRLDYAVAGLRCLRTIRLS